MNTADYETVDLDFIALDTHDDNRQTVLIVEDEESYQDALRSGLSREGYRVEVASTGVEALRKFFDSFPIWCSWTSCYPISQVRRSAVKCLVSPQCPSLCCRPSALSGTS